MGRLKNKVPRRVSTIMVSEEVDNGIDRIQCASALWGKKLVTRSDVIDFSISFIVKNIEIIDKEMRKIGQC